MGIVSAGFIWQGFRSAKNKHHLTACQWIAAGFLTIAGIGQVYYIPYIEPVKSARRAAQTIQSLLPQDGTVAFYRRRFDNGWNFYLDKPIIPVITNEQIKQAQPDYDLIILRKKHLKLLKAALDMNRYRIAASEPVGSKQVVLLKYDGQ